VAAALHQHGYADGTRAQYRTVLRSFYRYARRRPARTDEALVHGDMRHARPQDVGVL
jgi:hypothetical protein